MTTIILGILFVVGGTLAYVALRNAQDFSDANEIIPGVATNAPKEWAGAHSREARLHRRLRDAMEPLRAEAVLDGAGLDDVRTQLEQHALRIDDQLVAVAALAKGRREAPMANIADAVSAVEAAVAEVIALRGPAAGDLEEGIRAVRTRVELIAAARAELAAFDPSSPDLAELADRIGVDTDVELPERPPQVAPDAGSETLPPDGPPPV